MFHGKTPLKLNIAALNWIEIEKNTTYTFLTPI